jgi:hypothetical protein
MQPLVVQRFPQRILIFSEDSHLALALEVALAERGYVLRSEDNQIQVKAAIKEFAPDALIMASSTMVFIYRRNAEILDLPRPVDTEKLLHILEAREECLL